MIIIFFNLCIDHYCVKDGKMGYIERSWEGSPSLNHYKYNLDKTCEKGDLQVNGPLRKITINLQ